MNQCQCCGYEGDELNVKSCMICNSLFCEECIKDHPCKEGMSNYQRESPFEGKFEK